jgi:hypothetical protein
VLETVRARLDHHPEKMTIRRQTAEHPLGTIKCWMGATHFLTKRLPKVATEMALRGMLRAQINAGRRPGSVWGGHRVDSAQIGVP